MKSDIVTINDSLEVFGASVNNIAAMTALSEFFATPDDMEKASAVVENKETLHDIHYFCEVADAVIKNFKTMIECAANVLPALSSEFKWNKPKVSTTCKDMGKLFELATTLYDVNDECFAAKMKPITAKDAANLLGLSEQALLETHGDIFESKESKPSLKRTY